MRTLRRRDTGRGKRGRGDGARVGENLSSLLGRVRVGATGCDNETLALGASEGKTGDA